MGGVWGLALVIYPDYSGGIGRLLRNGGEEEHVWETEDPFRHILVHIVMPWG